MTFFNKLVLGFALVTTTVSAHAASRSFRIFSFRQVTPQVDRLYGVDGGAFGTLFCRAQAAEVMFVDARVPELDGLVFQFASLEACNAARSTLRTSIKKCKTELVLELQARTAQVITSHCRP